MSTVANTYITTRIFFIDIYNVKKPTDEINLNILQILSEE